MQQKPSHGEKLGNWYSYLSQSMGAFLYPILILWYTSAYGKCMGFPINFPKHGKRQQNPSNGESLRNCFPYNFQSLSVFSHRFTLDCGILHHMGNTWVSPPISHSTEKSNKTHRIGGGGGREPGKLVLIHLP